MLDLINAITFPSWISEDAIRIGNFSVKWYGISYIIGIYGAYIFTPLLWPSAAMFGLRGRARANLNLFHRNSCFRI